MDNDWSVYALLEWEGEAICIHKRRDGELRHVGLPGGRKNVSEKTPVETLVREVREETGITIKRPQTEFLTQNEAWVMRRPNKKTKAERHYYDVYYYRVALTRAQYDQRVASCSEGDVVNVTICTIPTKDNFMCMHKETLLKTDIFDECPEAA